MDYIRIPITDGELNFSDASIISREDGASGVWKDGYQQACAVVSASVFETEAASPALSTELSSATKGTDVPPSERTYPYQDGPHTVLGPEIFTSEDRSTICWEGRNYIPADKLVGYGDYLDETIKLWRARRDGPPKSDQHGVDLKHTVGETDFAHMCAAYIDAFQSARMSLVGKLLPDV